MIMKNGVITVSGEHIGPGLLEQDFLRSSLNAASHLEGANDGYTRYRGRGTLENGLSCFFTLIFYKGVLRLMTWKPVWSGTPTSWRDWSENEELKIKELNDELLKKYLGPPPYKYGWGTIESDYDARGGSSSIVISYAKQ